MSPSSTGKTMIENAHQEQRHSQAAPSLAKQIPKSTRNYFKEASNSLHSILETQASPHFHYKFINHEYSPVTHSLQSPLHSLTDTVTVTVTDIETPSRDLSKFRDILFIVN